MSAVNLPIELSNSSMSKNLSAASLSVVMRWAVWLLCNGLALYLVIALYAQGQTVFALLGLVVCGLASFIFINQRAYAHRYIFPAVAGMLWLWSL